MTTRMTRHSLHACPPGNRGEGGEEGGGGTKDEEREETTKPVHESFVVYGTDAEGSLTTCR